MNLVLTSEINEVSLKFNNLVALHDKCVDAIDKERELKSKSEKTSVFFKTKCDRVQGLLKTCQLRVEYLKKLLDNTITSEDRVKELEDLLEKYQHQINILQVSDEPIVADFEREPRVEPFKRDEANAELKAEIQVLQKQIQTLESRSGGNLRVLQMRDNPESRIHAIRQSKLDALLKENDALLRDRTGVAKESFERVELDLSLVKEELVGSKKRLERLKQVF